MDTFSLSEVQAQAILEMQLRRLQGLEREKIEEELKNLHVKIADYRDILAKPEWIAAIAVSYTHLGELSFSLPQNLLKSIIRQTVYAVSQNENKPVHMGCLFELSLIHI